MVSLIIDANTSADEFYSEVVSSIGDAGFDLYTPADVTIPPGTCTIVGMGVRCQMKNSDTGDSLPFCLYSRSSIAKTPLILTNGVGVIDKTYRGEIKAALRNLDTEPYTIKRGERLVQICAHDLSDITVYKGLVDESETARGGGGFGSTGV